MRALLRPVWIITTVLVIAAAGVLVRLGIWQLQRLEERRAFNARVLSQIEGEELDLNRQIPAGDLFDMEYRRVVVTGTFDHAQEVLLRNQVWGDEPGYHILTPLMIQGSEWSILVDRGWIPMEGAQNLEGFQEKGLVMLQGRLRRPQDKPDFGGVPDPTLAPGETGLQAWNIVNLARIEKQVTLPLLPVYIEAHPEPGTGLHFPLREDVVPEVSEGSHLGYAFQFFGFAVILLFGFPFYVRRELKRQGGPAEVEGSTMNALSQDAERAAGRH